MTLEQKVGQVFMLGFEGTRLDDTNRALVHNLHLGGVTVFARNVENARQLARLSTQLQSVADGVPLFVSADQEGGLVVRVTEGATVFPGNMALGASGDVALARRVAEAAAAELLAMGINMNLAPVVDVNTRPTNPVIGVRAFGSDVELVSHMGVATVQGLQTSQVSAVAKHFPGHGDTEVDSHAGLPVLAHPLARLVEVEFAPFVSGMEARVDGIMSAHVSVPAIEPQAGLPATLSRAVLTGLLREKLGYGGLILTDSLDMAAIKQDRTVAEAAVQAFVAGADMLLIGGIAQEDRACSADAPRALLEAVLSGRVSEERLDASVLRVLQSKARRGLFHVSASAQKNPPHGEADVALPSARTESAETVLNCAAHRALALEVARRAVTVHRRAQGMLPLRSSQRILVVTPDAPTRSLAQDDQLAGSLLEALQRVAPAAFGAPCGWAAAAARHADVVVLGTFDLAQDEEQRLLAVALAQTGTPVVGVGMRGPYDAGAAPQVSTFLTIYGDRPVHLQAAVEALFGRLAPTGRAP